MFLVIKDVIFCTEILYPYTFLINTIYILKVHIAVFQNFRATDLLKLKLVVFK